MSKCEAKICPAQKGLIVIDDRREDSQGNRNHMIVHINWEVLPTPLISQRIIKD